MATNDDSNNIDNDIKEKKKKGGKLGQIKRRKPIVDRNDNTSNDIPIEPESRPKRQARTGEIVTFGKLKTVEDYQDSKHQATSSGVLARIKQQQKDFYSSMADQLQGLTFVDKKKAYAHEREFRKKRSKSSNGLNIIDVIDPLPISLDDEHFTSNEVVIAKQSPSIQSKSAALGVPTATTKKTYDDVIMSKKFGPDFKETITDQFDDPYNERDKWRWHDGFRVNGAAQACLVVRSEFTLGAEYTKTQLDTTKHFSADEREQERAEIDRINKVPLYRWFKQQCDKIDRDVKFNYWAQGGIIQKWQYGRAAIVIQDDPDTGLPVALKLLNAMKLGRVFVDVLHWKVQGVEYVDFDPPENIVLAKNMVYLVNKNFHNSPNTLHYGLSDYETIRDVLETDVLIESIDIKEINKRLWAAIILVRVFSEDEDAVTKLRMALKTGKSVFATIDYEAQQLKIEHDLAGLLSERRENRDKIFNDLQVPKVLGFGGSEAGSKSEASIVAHAWNQGPLAKQKLLIRTDFEEQYYNTTLEKLAKFRAKYHKITPKEIKTYKEKMDADREKDLEFEPEEPTDERELLIHLLSMDVIDWPIKMKIVTKDIDFSSPIEQAALATTLKAAEIIDQLKSLEIMGYDDMIDRLKADNRLDLQTKSVVQRLFDAGMDPTKMDVPTLFKALMQAMQGGNGHGNAPTNATGQAKGVPTLETIKRGTEAKAQGIGVSPGDVVRRITSRTKLPSPQTGISTAE